MISSPGIWRLILAKEEKYQVHLRAWPAPYPQLSLNEVRTET